MLALTFSFDESINNNEHKKVIKQSLLNGQ